MSDFKRVASLSDVPLGGTFRVRFRGRWICLYNVDGEIYATVDECSHAVASLSEGELNGYIITCPRHGATFDVRTGHNLSLPAVSPVTRYEVKLEGDDILLSR